MDFKLEVAKLIEAELDNALENVDTFIEIPPDTKMGDFAFPCFRLSKALRKSPNVIAEELATKILAKKSVLVENVVALSGYLNIFVNKKLFVETILKEVVLKKEKFGSSEMGKNRNIAIDYSSPNIAKPFHIGHLRSTVIGNALYNMYNFLGYHSVGINYLGDWGTQFGKLIVAYKKWGNKEEIEKSGIQELTKIYVKFHEEAEKDDSLNDEARAFFMKMQEGDEEALSLWKWFYGISMNEFERIYKILDISFDNYNGESFYNDKMGRVVNELKQKNLLIESDGAQIVDLEAFNMPPCLIIRRDGGTLYATRDIAAALYRKDTYDFEKCVYLTALDQNLHFSQFFKVIELMGYEWAKNLVHVPFGLVSLETGKLSTRKGNVVLMEEILTEAIAKTRDIIEEKNSGLPNKDEVARQVGIGAIKFNDLYNGRIKDVVFSWERMLNFEGETGPYVQYAHARACSILRKSGVENFDMEIDYSLLDDESSVAVCKLFSQFAERVVDATNRHEPSVVARFSVDLAQAFNKFYYDNAILNGEEALKNARLVLVYAVKNVLDTSLGLLGIARPEQM